MKQVLIIDDAPLFRDYLKDKLSNEKVAVETALNKRDGLTKMFSVLPDLIIMDADIPYDDLMDFLTQKSKNPNSSKIPLILSGPQLEREQLSRLALFRVVKYFNKPIKIDVFFEMIGRLLGVLIPLDTTPAVIETHIQGNIIFVEISEGLNREKMILLRYKLSDLLTENKIVNPKVVLMISNLELCFVDGGNLELLLSSILADLRIRQKNLKVLTHDKFTRDLVNGHEEYTEIEVSDNITTFLPSILPPASVKGDTVEQIIEHILTAKKDVIEGSVQMSFKTDAVGASSEEDVDSVLNVAIVDDDAITRSVLEKAFSVVGATSTCFENGNSFVEALTDNKFDVVILDILMPDISGFEVLGKMKGLNFSGIIIVYSSISKRESVIQALSLGASSYLIKPLKPEQIVQKAMELLNQAK